MNLPANLVVLNTCEIGFGKQINVGRFDRARAWCHVFRRRAGSLWKVDDSAIADLMTRFYEKMLKDGESVPAALRHAQVEMNQKERWASPYFWAGFEMQGEWRK